MGKSTSEKGQGQIIIFIVFAIFVAFCCISQEVNKLLARRSAAAAERTVEKIEFEVVGDYKPPLEVPQSVHIRVTNNDFWRKHKICMAAYIVADEILPDSPLMANSKNHTSFHGCSEINRKSTGVVWVHVTELDYDDIKFTGNIVQMCVSISSLDDVDDYEFPHRDRGVTWRMDENNPDCGYYKVN